MEARKIKAIIKRPDEKAGHMTWVSNSLKNLQTHVEGRIEAVTIKPGVVVVCNEEGRLKGMPYCCTAEDVPFVGTIIAVGAEGDEFTDVPISLKEWKEMIERRN